MTVCLRPSVDLAALLVLALAASPAPAQVPTIVSTIDTTPSAASRVERAVRELAALERWPYQSQQPCGVLASVLDVARPVAILTTPDCLDGLVRADATLISANVGNPAYFFTLADTVGDAFQRGSVVGILRSAAEYQLDLLDVLKALNLDVRVDPDSRGHAVLIAGLKSGTFRTICIIDDGTGADLRHLATAAGDPRSRVQIVPVAPPGVRSGVKSSDRSTTFRVAALPARFVAAPWQRDDRSAGGVSEVITFLTPSVAPSPRASNTSSSWLAALWRSISSDVYAAGRSARDPVPLLGVAPILITKGEVPEQIVATVKRAWLAAPVAASINPCSTGREQRLYRSFLRAAWREATDAHAVAAIWEHASLLESRNERQETYSRQRIFIEGLLTQARPHDLAHAFTHRSRTGGSCKPPTRWGFASTKAVSFYQQGIKHLREALAHPSIDSESASFRDAEACLREAFNATGGKSPTCGEKLNGMWTTYYAPYLAMAIIDTETQPGRPNVRPRVPE